MRVLPWRDFTSLHCSDLSPAEAQGLQVGEMGQVGQAGDVVVGEVQVDQLDQV